MRRTEIVVTLFARLLACADVCLALCASPARADTPTPQPSNDSPATSPPPAPGATSNDASPSATAPAPNAVKPVPLDPTSGLHLLGGRPTPLQVDYAQYGLGIGGNFNLAPGPICPAKATTPCILGSGGGLTLRGAYRPAGPWYFGAAYQFSKLDSNNLFRLGIFQQLRFETRYYLDFGSRITPFLEWGGGGCVYGNLWGVSTGGAVLRAGGGFQLEITRFVVVGLTFGYTPALLAGYTDATNQKRDTGITHFLHFEVLVELKSELGRE